MTESQTAIQKVVWALEGVCRRLSGHRVWRGMEWEYHPLTEEKYLPLQATVDAQIRALTRVLDQLPDATKMIDTGIDRGAWSDVPNATKWVDELRGDEPPNSATDVVEPEEWDHPPHRNCECKHCKEYWSDVYPQPIGEIVEAHGLVAVSIPKMPPVGTKLYAQPDLLNQTCCECGRSGGYALYCGDCWNKVTDH